MQEIDKNPNVVVREITQVLQDFYKDRIVPEAQSMGLDPVVFFNEVMKGTLTEAQISRVLAPVTKEAGTPGQVAMV